jgi:hypothetical protein
LLPTFLRLLVIALTRQRRSGSGFGMPLGLSTWWAG